MWRRWRLSWSVGTEIACAAVFGALMAATWIWPLTHYVDGESDAVDFDEGFFVLLILLVPSVGFMLFIERFLKSDVLAKVGG